MKRLVVAGGSALILAAVWRQHATCPKPIPAAVHWSNLLPATPKLLRTGAKAFLRPKAALPASPTFAASGDPELPTDFAASLNGLLTDTSPGAVEAQRELVRRWAEAAPAAAAAWTAGLPAGPLQQQAIQQVVVAWAEVDPFSAKQWVATLPDNNDKQAALISLGYEAARTDPMMSLELAAAFPATPERDDLLIHAASQWAGTDLDSALLWARQVPDPALGQRLLSAIATAVAKQDGAAAAAMVANFMTPGDEQNRAAVAVVQRWAQVAPESARDWVALYPAGPTRDAAAQSLQQIQSTIQGQHTQESGSDGSLQPTTPATQ